MSLPVFGTYTTDDGHLCAAPIELLSKCDCYREALEAIARVNVNPKAEVGSYLQTIATAALKG